MVVIKYTHVGDLPLTGKLSCLVYEIPTALCNLLFHFDIKWSRSVGHCHCQCLFLPFGLLT